ncbi:protein rough sheath 2 homolog [Zingiber officinale]|nr:protein rough sheath 2 homolog [Zingiber officinale]
MRERQRWQPEEDALLREYVKQYGAKEWALVSERMGRPLHRDPKSCHERWRNYLRPGLKKGSLSPDEQSLLISLQARYGNKWKAIAAHLPGRTPKRLGKWWEVFKEKQLKLNTNHTSSSSSFSSSSSPFAFPPSVSAAGAASPSAYEHILHTFAEKHALNMTCADHSPSPGSSSSAAAAPSVALSLSISPPPAPELAPHQLSLVARLCEEVEEGRRAWAQHRKDAAWRLSRLEQQMETEKARRKREKVEEVEERIRRLREEEKVWLERADAEWRERMGHLRTEAEAEEMEKAEAWARKQTKLLSLIQTIAGGEGRGSSRDHSILQFP